MRTKITPNHQVIETANFIGYVDNDTFSDLFFHPRKYRDTIWYIMKDVVSMAAAKVPNCTMDMQGDALIHAIEVIPSYDPMQRTAFNFFYNVALHKLERLMGIKQPETVAEDDAAFCLHDFYEFGSTPSPTQAALSQATPDTDYQLPPEAVTKASRYFSNTLEKARKIQRESDSGAEKATLTVMIETLKQARRALVG